MALVVTELDTNFDVLATWGRLRTTRALCWLQWLAEYQHGDFCVRRGRL